MADLVKFGFIHDKAEANAYLKSSGMKDKPDAGADMFYFQFDGAITGEVMIDVEIDGHTYSMSGQLGPKAHACYGSIGTSKSKTSFDFVDKQPVAEASGPWPVLKDTTIQSSMTVSTFTGGIETYPSQLTQVNGADGKPVKGISLPLSQDSPYKAEITKDGIMADVNKDITNKGCNFDATTAKAIHGKKLILLVTNGEVDSPLAMAGQQGLTWQIEADTSEAGTKDGTGEWRTKTQGQKTWTASTDGLIALGDKGRAMVMNALKTGEPLCCGMYAREDAGEGKTKYTPIRKGMAIVTGDEIDAPADDNATYSVTFDGTGECWMAETVTPEELEEYSFTATSL